MANPKLNIAFFGSSLLSSYWNGAATYYRGIIKSLYQRGHQVTFYEPDAYDRQKHRDIEEPEWAKVKVYANDEQAVNAMLEQAKNADIIIKASGVGVFDELLEKEVLNIRSSQQKVFFWDVDAPATLDRVENNSTDSFKPLIGQYDAILTYGGGEPVKQVYKSLGAKDCIPIYNALDPETHFPTAPKAKFRSDLAFLGNRLPDREERVDEFLLEAAKLLPAHSFIIGGSGWQDKKLPGNVSPIGHVGTNDHNAFNCTPKAVLNISRQSMADYGFSPATRVFEAAGAGACIITDSWKGIELFLEPETEILVANSGKEVAEILDNLSNEEANDIGKAAQERVLNEHTYGHRAQELENVLYG